MSKPIKGRSTLADEELGKRLKALRKASGLTLNQLGRKVGISYQQVQKYETGSNKMSALRLHQICHVLNVPMSYFFDLNSKELSFINNIEDSRSIKEVWEGLPRGRIRLSLYVLMKSIQQSNLDCRN